MLTDPLSLVSPPLFRAADIRAIDRLWAEAHPDASLMERAGTAAAELAGALASESGEPVLVLAGPGNNGGDALVAARLLAAQGFHVTVVSRADPARLPWMPHTPGPPGVEAGGRVHADIPAGQRFSLVIDGLFGVGLVRDVAGNEARWIALANAWTARGWRSTCRADSTATAGGFAACALRADHTLTFLGLKPGLLTADGPDCAGELHLDMRSASTAAALPTTPGFALTQLERPPSPARARAQQPQGRVRPCRHHRRRSGMVGACLIAGRAALQQGAGSVTLGVLDERIAVDYCEPRLMFAACRNSAAGAARRALAIGPGLGTSRRAHMPC
jgi:ADP-dependent NAD(P)H-hydrate dehydratase / NAD(P)H-hydrate epimerase